MLLCTAAATFCLYHTVLFLFTHVNANMVVSSMHAAPLLPLSSVPFRVFKHAIDDLRLFKALEEAGMSGRIIVVDSLEGADAVLCTRRKSGGKEVSVKEVGHVNKVVWISL